MTGPNIAAGNPTVATFPMAIAKPEAKPAFCNPTSIAIVRQSFSGRLGKKISSRFSRIQNFNTVKLNKNK
jgi:hypothetical protein